MHSRSKQTSGKSTSGGGSVKITKTVARKTTSIDDTIVALRKAVYNDDGTDKDVCAALKPFMKYERQGLDIEIKCVPKLTKTEREWAFDLIKENMEERYDASGYGWDDEDKMRELSEGGARFLVARWSDNADSLDQGELCAIAHFRFSVQGDFLDKMEGDSCLIVWDIHVEHEHQRKGLGKHLLTILELVAKRENISRVYIPVQLEDDIAQDWVDSVCLPKGYSEDPSLAAIGFDSEMEGFLPFCKNMTAPPPKKDTSKAAAPVTVFTGKDVSNQPQPEVVEEQEEEPLEAEQPEDVAEKIKILKKMFSEKFGKEPTDEEFNEWVFRVFEKEDAKAGAGDV
eukprot:GSChrysophyteH1.ASY1.ANO1.3055.1 assembled CDS